LARDEWIRRGWGGRQRTREGEENGGKEKREKKEKEMIV
jgi:hypothetical protein